MPTAAEHLEAAIAGLIVPDDLKDLSPARLRRLRDCCYVVQKFCGQVLAQRVCEPKAGIVAQLNEGERSQ